MLRLVPVIGVIVVSLGAPATASAQFFHGPLAAETWRVDAGQSPEREALAAYLDSLEHVHAPDALHRIADGWDKTIHPFPKELGTLRRGYYELREAQLSHRIGDYERALGTFQRATAQTPSAAIWYAFGFTNIDMRIKGLPDRRITDRHMSGYLRFYVGGREALIQSLDLDPDFGPSLELLLGFVVAEGDREQPDQVIEAMVTAAGVMPDDPRPCLVLGRNARRAQDLVEALSWFHQYRSRGGDPGIAGLEISRTLFGLGSVDDGSAAYWGGLVSPRRAGRDLYRRDLSWIAVQSEIDEFDRLKADSLVGWVKDFWADRDAAAVRPSGERLTEHMRRWFLVHRQFRVSRPMARATLNPPWLFERPTPCSDGRDPTLDGMDFLNPSRPNDLRAWEPFLDNRAPVYMRHGEPMRRVWSGGTSAEGVEQSAGAFVPGGIRNAVSEERGVGLLDQPVNERRWEVWAYWIDGEPRAFSFVPSRALGMDGPTTLSFKTPSTEWYWNAVSLLSDYVGDFSVSSSRDMARARHDRLVREAGLPRALPNSRCSSPYQRWIDNAKLDMELATHTDGYVLFFPENLSPTITVAGLPGIPPATDGTILAVYSIPLSNLVPSEVRDSTSPIAVRLRVSATDGATGGQLWADSTRLYRRPANAPANSHLSGYLELHAPPGTYQVRMAVQLADSSSGNTFEWDEPVAVWLSGPDLELSDIVTGGSTGNLVFWFGRSAVAIDPLDMFRSNTKVDLFYVQGGMNPGDTYRTTLKLTAEDDDDELISLSFEELARTQLENKRRGLALQELDEGVYILTITVEELATGRTTESLKRLYVGAAN